MMCSFNTVIVAEGMPGAGKTTVLAALGASGHTMLGEYTTRTGTVLPFASYPCHRDEDAHLVNWLRKTAQLHPLTGLVWVDRDWLTALAWAASTTGLPARAAWVYHHLKAGRLVLPQRWLIFDLPPAMSLHRRTSRLDPSHPWSQLPVLESLRAFYRDPAATLKPAHPSLAALVATVPVQQFDATATPAELTRAVQKAATP